MSDTQYVNFDAIKKDIKPTGIIVTLVMAASIVYGSYALSDIRADVSDNKEAIEVLRNDVTSIQDQIRSNSDVFVALQQQIDSSSVLISGNEQDILLLAAKTNTKVGGLSKKIKSIEGRAMAVENRTLALEQAVDMPGANPLDVSVIKYHQREK